MKRKITVIINNSININRTNNHFLQLNTKKPIRYSIGNDPNPVLGQAQKYGVVKHDLKLQYRHKQTIKIMLRFVSTQNDHSLLQKMNDNINMNSTIAGSAHN